MNKFWKIAAACAAVAALGVTGCERDRDNDNDGVFDRLERRADRTGDDIRNTTNDTVDDTEDRMEQAGRDMNADGGITYEVAKVDKEAKRVELRRANMLPTVTDKKDIKKPMDALTVTFDDLARFVEGEKPATEIAEELHEGENVTVFMGADKKITKITY